MPFGLGDPEQRQAREDAKPRGKRWQTDYIEFKDTMTYVNSWVTVPGDRVPTGSWHWDGPRGNCEEHDH